MPTASRFCSHGCSPRCPARPYQAGDVRPTLRSCSGSVSSGPAKLRALGMLLTVSYDHGGRRWRARRRWMHDGRRGLRTNDGRPLLGTTSMQNSGDSNAWLKNDLGRRLAKSNGVRTAAIGPSDRLHMIPRKAKLPLNLNRIDPCGLSSVLCQPFSTSDILYAPLSSHSLQYLVVFTGT